MDVRTAGLGGCCAAVYILLCRGSPQQGQSIRSAPVFLLVKSFVSNLCGRNQLSSFAHPTSPPTTDLLLEPIQLSISYASFFMCIFLTYKEFNQSITNEPCAIAICMALGETRASPALPVVLPCCNRNTDSTTHTRLDIVKAQLTQIGSLASPTQSQRHPGRHLSHQEELTFAEFMGTG